MIGRSHSAMVPIQDQDHDEAEPENDIAPTRTDRGDRAVTLVFYDAAGTAAKERPNGRKEEEQDKHKGVKVMVSWAGMSQKNSR